MDYPKYKHKRYKIYGRYLLLFILANFVLSFFVPWYSYVHGSILFVVMATNIFKRYRGFKAFSAFMFAVMIMLLIFDFEDSEFTWSLDYVFPSFLIAIGVIQFILIMFRRKSWKKNYDIHVYVLLLNILMVLLLLFGVIESSVLVIVTYSIIVATMIVIRIRVGKSYGKNIDKFTHL